MAEQSMHWTEAQKLMYGRVFRFIATNQQAVRHPDTPMLPRDEWETIAHNAAWLAAEFLEPGDIDIRDTDTGELVATTKAQPLH